MGECHEGQQHSPLSRRGPWYLYASRNHQNNLVQAKRRIAVRPNIRGIVGPLAAMTLLLCGACETPGQRQNREQESLANLHTELAQIHAQVDEANAVLDVLAVDQQLTRDQWRARLDEVAALEQKIDTIPSALAGYCLRTAPPSNCAEVEPQIIGADGSFVVGELEYIWLDPPGITLEARVDTGASRSSLSASEPVEFERDGDKWVRFTIGMEEEPFTIELPVVKYVKVVQQADPEGTRRPVISLQVRIGDLADTFEFTLADRSHLQNPVILGRDFLTDIAIVDVSKRFLHPRLEPER